MSISPKSKRVRKSIEDASTGSTPSDSEESVMSAEYQNRLKFSSHEGLYLNFENLVLLAFTIGIIYLGTFNQVFMLNIYLTESWHLFDHTMKIANNYFGHAGLKRSYTRNVVFNIHRCMAEEPLFWILYGYVDHWYFILWRICSIAIMSVAFQLYFSAYAAHRYPRRWSYIQVFYVTSYALTMTRNISICEISHSGHLSRVGLLVFYLCMNFLSGDLLEDLIFGGLNRLGGFIHNWEFFFPSIGMFFLGYAMNHYYLDGSAGEYRYPEQEGQMPIHWPVIQYKEEEQDRFSIVLMAHCVYALFTFFCQVRRKASLVNFKIKTPTKSLKSDAIKQD